MTARLANYQHGYRITSLCKSARAFQKQLGSDLESLLVFDDEVELYPSGARFRLDQETSDYLAAHEDFDVMEIYADGRLFASFSNASSDNAIFITGRCNSSCIMCPDSDKMRSTAEVRELATLLKLVRSIPSDARHLTITGGEPFLLGWDTFILLATLREKFTSTEFLLLTNGRVLSVKSFCDELQRMSPLNLTVGIPIHGHNACTHDHVTQVDGSFDQTLIGVKNLVKRGIRVELRVVVSKISADYLGEIADLIAHELRGVSCVKIIGLEMLGSAAANRDAVWIPYPEAFEKSKPAIRKLVEEGIDVGLYNFPLCAVEKGYWHICENSISDHKVRYYDECESCVVKESCGGVFAGSQRFARFEIQAVQGDAQ